jgi:hypothetical protein
VLSVPPEAPPELLPDVPLPDVPLPEVPVPPLPVLSDLPVAAGLLGVAVVRVSWSEQYAATLSSPPAAVTSRCQAVASSALPRLRTCS